MTTTWILVANASLAHLYENTGPNTGLHVVKELVHPQSRLKNAELVTDRAGSMMSSGNGQGARQPQTAPKDHQAQVFAHELAQALNHGRTQNLYRRAIVFAPPGFMGLLNGELDHQTAQMITDRFEKDYTKSSESQLREHLASCLFL